MWQTDPPPGIAPVRNPAGLVFVLPLRLIRSLFGRQERLATAARDLSLKPDGFDAMASVMRVEGGDYGRVNECESKWSRSLPAGRKACVSGKNAMGKGAGRVLNKTALQLVSTEDGASRP